MRLDLFIAQQFDFSRQKAQDLIKKGRVLCNGNKIVKPAFDVDATMHIELAQERIFVSRAGEKLFDFLKNQRLDKKIILDVGSSTGGFAQVLLILGASEVHCVDVGNNQLDLSLRNDKKIKVFERCDIRDFQKQKDYDLLTCDVSFIRIENIFDCLKKLSNEMILLFKPQFEVGKDAKRNKKGVLVDEKLVLDSLEKFENYLQANQCKILKKAKSLLKGRAGNQEYFFHIKCNDESICD